MRVYRIYVVSDDNHVMGPPHERSLSDDDEAAEQAKLLLREHTLEVWDGSRLVARFQPAGCGRKDP